MNDETDSTPSIPRPSSLSRPQSVAASSSSSSSSIPRPSSLLVGPSSQLRAPTSLFSGALPPSLLQDSLDQSEGGLGVGPPVRPRRLWNINDTSLQRIPPGYPPLNPQCTTFVGDASPSIVAVRISECLRKRSISAEYDEETAIASALTVDRCMFQVKLFQANPEISANGVIVECMRISGSVISFHTASRAILQAASGQSTGDDRKRKLYQCNGREFLHMPNEKRNRITKMPSRPLLLQRNEVPGMPVSDKSILMTQALEDAKELLDKDRLDTQVLGMERLVDLTTPTISGKEMALFVSRHLVEEEPNLMVKRVRSTEDKDLLNQSTLGTEAAIDEGYHASKIRACGIRALSNALCNLADALILKEILKNDASHPLTQNAFLDSLMEDLKGMNRPPSVVQAGTNTLASVHEAALVLSIFRVLGDHSKTVVQWMHSDSFLERLDEARVCGRATHNILQKEAECIYEKLSDHIRSC